MKRPTQSAIGIEGDDTFVIQSEMERLHREHRELKARLSELNSHIYLSPEEEIERKKIQKLKLATKDRLVWLDVMLRQS